MTLEDAVRNIMSRSTNAQTVHTVCQKVGGEVEHEIRAILNGMHKRGSLGFRSRRRRLAVILLQRADCVSKAKPRQCPEALKARSAARAVLFPWRASALKGAL
jgi:hypothetical protein